ncbi:hypothetical protein VSDG_04038 [Cytospora chrysosperma]|uniref:N-acetyltransferase domain-containing protein n=1 Tax=Cytospora chrysosperma TaxID=252740 RepID=A0A423W7E9_CYTCH|nr:hypothetical protein VSDG_04038 [Valsa sordida]
MSKSPRFHVREAESSFSDDKFVLAAFDSALPYLASIGSHEMWGLTSFSQRDGWAAETSQQVKDAETYRLTEQGEALRIFIVEAELPAEVGEGGPGSNLGILKSTTDKGHELQTRIRPEDGRRALPVGFAFVREDWIPQYIASQEHLGLEDAERSPCVYIEVMVADHRVSSEFRKGSGAALIQRIKEYGQRTHRRALFVDGWAGNDKRLISYYTRQGFQVIDDFSLPRKDKAPWLGTLLRMEVE